MLPPAHRLTRSADFASTMRRGRRARRGGLVVHHSVHSSHSSYGAHDAHSGDRAPTASRVGLVVGRAVGGSVVRHRVSRRLRALLAARLSVLPVGSVTVVRALPGAAAVGSVRLGQDLDAAFSRLGLDRVVA